MEDNYYEQGRLFTKQQMSTFQSARSFSIKDSMYIKSGKLICNRCHQEVSKRNLLPNGKCYCRSCIAFGRVESDSQLFYFETSSFPKGKYLKWDGKLTSYQEKISKFLIGNFLDKKNSLVHAVTGAGKTEMIYKLIELVINKGGWVCFTSPRVDVCIDIKNRLVQDFSCPITIIYGGSESYTPTPLLVATTHQLLKFYHAFDLLIIDEIDAFPFVGNLVLNHATQACLKTDGKVVCLTATSTNELEKKVREGCYEKIRLSRRFHNYPLVVPKFQLIFPLVRHINNNKIPKLLRSLIRQQRLTGYPLLIFYPLIAEGEKFTKLLEMTFPNEKIAFVSSRSETRKELVQAFKNREVNILVTTTILERGVTFPEVDVFVVLANHKLFTSSSLIQIAGRVGRAISRPNGQLLFIHEGISLQMKKARCEIIKMNKEAYGK